MADGGFDPDEDNDLEQSVSSVEKRFCTLAITGSVPTFQAIFVCHQCVNKSETQEGEDHQPLCICQSCAEVCHSDEYGDLHDVEYIGMGPCYCDCDHVGTCCLLSESRIEAERIGATSNASLDTETIDGDDGEIKEPFLLPAAHDIPFLQGDNVAEILIRHARTLILHSKETFWLDSSVVKQETLSPLERLAWDIYLRHRHQYDSSSERNSSNFVGAEWWVQVKTLPSNGEEEGISREKTGIDLHYDKDELLAETFHLGFFPTLSTVTYLTAVSELSAPTIVLDHVYTSAEDEVIDTMMVSRPRLGKHIVFDGKLLHGAPSHPLLLPQSGATGGVEADEGCHVDDRVRVTFLVNIWAGRKPAGIFSLPPDIREELLKLESPHFDLPLEWTARKIEEMSVNKDEDLPERLRRRIELPFVPKGLTDDDDEEEPENYEEGGLVLITMPPPPIRDTAMIKFGSGCQAYLEYSGHDEVSTEKMTVIDSVEAGYV